MPTTSRLGLRYPALTDAPNGPQALQQLAEDAEGWHNRAFPCTSTSRPASPAQGMIIYETDTGEWRGWTGVAWELIGSDPAGGGGGGAATVVADAQYAANSTQSITNNVSRVVAFGAEQAASDYVVRTPRSVGHEFELTIGGLWHISATLRFAASNANGERRFELVHDAAPTSPFAAATGGDQEPVMVNIGAVRRFAAGAKVYAQAYQLTGGTRTLEPGPGGAWVRINFALVGR